MHFFIFLTANFRCTPTAPPPQALAGTAAPGATAPPAAGALDLHAELLAELKVQTALLQRLVEAQDSSPVPPLGDGLAAPTGGDVEADG